MAIAARCSQVFCKLFNIQVDNNRWSLWIDLYPINGSHEDDIHMVSDRNSNRLEVYFNFDSMKFPFTEEALNCIAYKLGIGILKQYAIVDNGVIFTLDESINYPFYENTFSFMDIDQKERNITTDFPLLHHLETELEVGTSIYFETHEIIRPNSNVVKNGIPMFEIDKFRQQQIFLIISIIKKDSTIEVELENHNFIENAADIFSAMSLISALPFYGNDEENSKDGLAKLYLSSSNKMGFINIVQIHRFDNTLLSKEDIKRAIPKIQDSLGLSASFCVDTFWGLH